MKYAGIIAIKAPKEKNLMCTVRNTDRNTNHPLHDTAIL